MSGQLCLLDAVRLQLRHEGPDGRVYELPAEGRLATLVVRPRGWHLDERHVLVDGRPAVAALVDFGLHVFHNAAELLARGSGPYLYVPKMEEILAELGEHATGLNAGRWDHLFSMITTFRDQGPSFVLPDRNQVAMTSPFMRAYTDARELFERVALDDDYVDFLTLVASERIDEAPVAGERV